MGHNKTTILMKQQKPPFLQEEAQKSYVCGFINTQQTQHLAKF
jgi:hypothetical protein